jgi:thioredoxin reductase
LIDPERYQFQHLLVVGGGDSALEAACALAEQDGNRVTLSYRGKDFNRPKPANLERLRAAQAAGTLTLMLSSTVKRIELDRVELTHEGRAVVVPNDFVFVFAGGILPTKLLTEAGIRLQRHHGKRIVAIQP